MNRPMLFLAFALAASTAQGAIPFDETRALAPDAKVSLDNMQGRIEVSTWDRNEIRIAGERADATEALRIEGDASDLKVKIEYPDRRGWFGSWGGASGDSELRVTLPPGVSLSVHSVSARVEVTGVAGKRLSIDGVSGNVTVDSAARDVEIDVVSGDAEVNLRSGDVSIQSVSGDVRVRGAMDGRIELESVSGSIRLESESPARHVSAAVVSGDVQLKVGVLPEGRIQAESLSGDVELTLPAGTSAELRASSFTGTIRSSHGKVVEPEFGPGSSLSTTLGKGAGRIELETFSGDLTVSER